MKVSWIHFNSLWFSYNCCSFIILLSSLWFKEGSHSSEQWSLPPPNLWQSWEVFPCPPMGVASERSCSRPYPGAAAFECSLSPVAPVPASHLRCCILSYPAAGISTLLQVLQFLCHAWAVRSTQDVSFCLPDFRDKSVVILSIILFYAMHYFSLTVFFFFF